VKTRRTFLTGLLTLGAGTGLAARFAMGQNPSKAQDPGVSGDSNPENPATLPRDKRLLDENQKEIKKKVQKLYDLASELKAQVEKTDSSKVLSLDQVRKAEEIEKLAREIKNLSKG
jgi:hypothetical protein